MGFQKIFIIESYVPDNARAVCNDAEFIGIAEMPVDIHLLYGRVCIRVGRHEAIGGFVRIIGIIQVFSFLIGF